MRAVLFIAGLLVACQSHESNPPKTKTEPTTRPESKTQPESTATSAPTGTRFVGTPFGKDQSVVLRWKRDGNAELRNSCDGVANDGTKEMVKDEPILWDRAVTIVQHGTVVTSSVEQKIDVSPIGKLNEPQPTIEMVVQRGTSIEVLKRADSDHCFVRIENMFGRMRCPTDENYTAENWDGKSFQTAEFWCVEVDGGWLKVDEEIVAIEME